MEIQIILTREDLTLQKRNTPIEAITKYDFDMTRIPNKDMNRASLITFRDKEFSKILKYR